MDEEFVTNTIKSVYNRKPPLILSNERNNRKVNTNYHPKISNDLKKIDKIDELKNTKRKTLLDDIKINNLRYKLINDYKDHIKYEQLLKIKHNSEKNKTINQKVKRKDLIKKDKIIFLLRRLYIILPSDKIKMDYNLFPKKLHFDFYFPIENKPKRNLDFLESERKDDIICKNLNDISVEVYKYLKLSLYDDIKLEIFDDKLRMIKLESQLHNNKKRIIYIKISYNNEQINSWKKNIKLNTYPLKPKYKYNTSNEINQIEPDNINTKTCENKKSNEIENIKDNQSFNNDSINNLGTLTRYNTTDATKKSDKLTKIKLNLSTKKIENITLNSDENDKSISIDDINYKNYKTQGNVVETDNNQYIRTSNKIINFLGDKKDHKKNSSNLKIHTLKIKKNFFSDVIKKDYRKNTLLSPFLFDFEVTDIINNKYVLKYLTIKNRDEKEKDEIKNSKNNKFAIKTLKLEDSNSQREREEKNIFINLKTNLIDKNININSLKYRNSIAEENLRLLKNKKLFCEMIHRVNDYVDNHIDDLISDEEIEDIRYLSCNYILINELKEFPLLKLKKKFIFFVYLSQKMCSKYKQIYTNINYLESDIILNNILKINEFESSLIYLNQIFHKIINRKGFLIGYLGASNQVLKISFQFFFLFIFLKEHLINKILDTKLIYLSMQCIEIHINSELTFQEYCDFKLIMTRNSFISFNKKFNFIKDLILRIFINERFNTKNSLNKIKTFSNDISIYIIKKILNLDMCNVKLRDNIDIYNNVEKIYNDFLDYIEK